VNLSSRNEVPHIFTRNWRLRPAEFFITGAKKSFATYSLHQQSLRLMLLGSCPRLVMIRTR
jgi:hypothetical protein